ncbi:MAG: ribose-phosphate pyrophosphokinase [Bacteroidales bacterium]|nr:ribose-phosphate pyrophosphokinase [Bacteroidales bacterium]
MTPVLNPEFIIIGNVFDNYFAIDIADFLKQKTDIADLVSLKVFANTEFCPRFTVRGHDKYAMTGKSLDGKTVIIISVHNDWISRNELATRNMILARAAKDNGALRVILVEPDLFYSAQDRGPREDQGKSKHRRTQEDLYKFNGQPFTARLYAQLLKTSGVDTVVTIHNHSLSCQYEYEKALGKENFINLHPDGLYHSYLCDSGIIDPLNSILVSPDEGAADFIRNTAEISAPAFPFILFEKERKNERLVTLKLSEESHLLPEQIRGKDIVVLDDMVRTGITIVECCKFLKKYSPRKIIFMVTHFFSSDEIKRNLSAAYINEIITTNTLPTILNRDNQGRLRKKIAVLKINKWIAGFLNQHLKLGLNIQKPLYFEDISDKNPRSAVHPTKN